MRSRSCLIAGLVAVAALSACPVARAGQDGPLPTAVTVKECTEGAAPADRTATFSATMPRRSAAVSMGIRFRLYQRIGSQRHFKRVDAPGFGDYKRSAPNVAGFQFDKVVSQLAAPAAYRVKVDFAWYDAAGTVVSRTRRASNICVQRDMRPDLKITRIAQGPADASGYAPYDIRVRNLGRTAVLVPFSVGLRVAGTAAPAQVVRSLDAGEAVVLTIRAPRCAPGGTAVAVADPDGAVIESFESNNRRRFSC